MMNLHLTKIPFAKTHAKIKIIVYKILIIVNLDNKSMVLLNPIPFKPLVISSTTKIAFNNKINKIKHIKSIKQKNLQNIKKLAPPFQNL
jgi:hypothetical protein